MSRKAIRSIELRVVCEHDAQLLYNLMTAKNWLTYIGDKGVRSIEDASSYILENMHPELFEKGFVNHVIIDSETKEEVGTCSLHNREGVKGLDLGYAILEKYEGKGYATSSASMMIELAFNKYHVNVIRAITTDRNIASCRILEKLGFQDEGYLNISKIDEQLKLYQLKKENWYVLSV